MDKTHNDLCLNDELVLERLNATKKWHGHLAHASFLYPYQDGEYFFLYLDYPDYGGCHFEYCAPLTMPLYKHLRLLTSSESRASTRPNQTHEAMSELAEILETQILNVLGEFDSTEEYNEKYPSKRLTPGKELAEALRYAGWRVCEFGTDDCCLDIRHLTLPPYTKHDDLHLTYILKPDGEGIIDTFIRVLQDSVLVAEGDAVWNHILMTINFLQELGYESNRLGKE